MPIGWSLKKEQFVLPIGAEFKQGLGTRCYVFNTLVEGADKLVAIPTRVTKYIYRVFHPLVEGADKLVARPTRGCEYM